MGGKDVEIGKSENSRKKEVMDSAIVLTAATEVTQDLKCIQLLQALEREIE